MKNLRFVLVSVLSMFIGGLRRQCCTANVETASGTHEVLSRRADAAHSYRHLLCKAGSDEFHSAVCGASDYPIGITTDQPSKAEGIFNVNPLNHSTRTRPMRCATALAAEVDVYTGANGFAQALPAVVGTYFKVGRTVALAVQEASGNYVVEVTPCAPVKTRVIATATGTAGTDIAALFTALQGGPCEIKTL